MLKYLARALGLSTAAAKESFGLQSLRSGGATTVANSRLVDERHFQAHGGWADKRSMHVYLAANMDSRQSVTAALSY